MNPVTHAVGHRLTEFDRNLAKMLAIHFDPEGGAPFWLDRAADMDLDPLREIVSVRDLPRLGVMSPADLAGRRIEDFIPRSLNAQRSEMVFAQTGGTLGRPVWTTYLRDEFKSAFVTPFVVAARHTGFPEGKNWLYVGPSGPHVIGLAAHHIARTLGSPPPFTVDFDSRWARKLRAGSFAAGRYLNHVVEQAMDIVKTQEIGVLFSTPPVLRRLAESMSINQRRGVHGVHYGGLALMPRDLEQLQREIFPNAVHLSGYGNTLFGCALELDASQGREIHYFPHGHRLLMGIGRRDSAGQYSLDYDATGERGPLVFSRLDRTCLLLNVVERDEVTLIAPPHGAPPGFVGMGVHAPAPIKHAATPGPNLIY